MKASSLWPGTDYAYGYRGRGAPLPVNAERVKVLEIIKEPVNRWSDSSRDRTYVRIQRLNDDGMPNPNFNGDERVRGRDILEFWDEYIETVREDRERHKKLEEEREIKREEARKDREIRDAVYYIGYFLRNSWKKHLDRKEQEQRRVELEKKERRLTRVKNVMITRGFDQDKFSLLESHVTVSMDEMERWLGIDTESNQ